MCLIIGLSIGTGCTQRPVAYDVRHECSVADPRFAETIKSLLGTPLIDGNRVTTLTNGDEIFPAMLAAIRSAQQSINCETYIYWSGDIGQAFCDAFVERARAGVKVHVLLDWFGSNKIDDKFIRRMTDAGCAVEKYHPVHFLLPYTWGQADHRTHRKLLIVDGRVGFTGGVGIADEWTGHAQDPQHWRDCHFKVEGPAVAQLQSVFEDNWIQTTGQVLQGDAYFPKLDHAGHEWAQVFRSASNGGSENMQLLFLLSVAAAEHELRIASAYFVPDKLTIDALIAARRRGVHVSIIVPGKYIDETEVRYASHSKWGVLLKEGVEIYEYQPTMFHCKVIIVDGRWVSIGSANVDNRSFRLNDEANLNVLDEKFAAVQTEHFEHDKTLCKQMTYEGWKKRPFVNKLRDGFFSIFGDEL